MVNFEIDKIYLYNSPLSKFVMVFKVIEPIKMRHSDLFLEMLNLRERGLRIEIIYVNQDFSPSIRILSKENIKHFSEYSVELTL